MNGLGPWPERRSQVLAAGEAVWIFGAGGFGRAVARACLAAGVDVQGFVQTQPEAALVDGLPVRAWSELTQADRGMALLVGIFNRDTPIDQLVQLAQQAGFQRLVLPWDLHAQFAAELGWRFWLADPQYLRNHAQDLLRCHELLADETSRACLRGLLNFRLGLDLAYSSFTHPQAQYFNALSLSPFQGKSMGYVDGGAYNGDTLKMLVQCAQVKQAWLLEPDPANFRKLASEVRRHQLPGYCLPLALSEGYGILRFSSGLGEGGHFSEEGQEAIATVAIDDLLGGQAVDFIKLDIEGAESHALRGAARTLAAHRPVLALSCYHKPDDLWQLPGLIEELVPGGYDLHLRQHAFNSLELVLYATPRPS